MRALREAFMFLMPDSSLSIYESFPLFRYFNMSIKILAWNVQGVGNTVPIIKELIRINNVTLLFWFLWKLIWVVTRPLRFVKKINFFQKEFGWFGDFRWWLYRHMVLTPTPYYWNKKTWEMILGYSLLFMLVRIT